MTGWWMHIPNSSLTAIKQREAALCEDCRTMQVCSRDEKTYDRAINDPVNFLLARVKSV